MSQARVTSLQVALKAGVSQSAVSRVFTPGASASVKTIEKIKEKDPEMVDNINKLKNQILYNNKDNEI